MGIVTEDADRVVVRFTTEAEREITPGSIAEFGFRGFGLVFEAAELGVPTEVEVFRGSTSLGLHIIEDQSSGPWPYTGE
jgi:hypothetical protein